MGSLNLRHKFLGLHFLGNGMPHVVTSETTALHLGNVYLVGLGETDDIITTEECQFCPSEPLVFFSPDQQQAFSEQGGFILPLPS
jgi:hypothetical protein